MTLSTFAKTFCISPSGAVPASDSSLSKAGVYCQRAPNAPLRNFFRGNSHDFPNYALVGDKGSTNKERGKTHNSNPKFGNCRGETKAPSDPSQSQGEGDLSVFLHLTPQTFNLATA